MRRLATLVVAAVLALAVAAPASAQAADQQGWWNAVHRAGLPQPPDPPDVGPTDLLLQGGDPNLLLPAGTTDSPPAPTALAALRFTVAPGSTVGALTLAVGTGAQAMDVRAYPTTSAWKPAQGGAVEDAPAPDLSRYSSGVLSADGTTLVFRDIGRLVPEDGHLSVVLLPGAADRVVLHQPAATALVVTAPEPGATQVDPAAPVAPPAAVSDPGTAVAPPPGLTGSVDTAPLSGGVVPPAAVAAPQVPSVAAPAVPAPVPVAAAPVASVRSVLVPDDTRTRLVVLAEALLLLVFFGLLGAGPLARLATLTGQPDEAVDPERGVGRFRATREGSAPRL